MTGGPGISSMSLFFSVVSAEEHASASDAMAIELYAAVYWVKVG